MRNLSSNLLSQLYAQQSEDPLLMILTLTHVSFSTIRLVNNTVDVTSNGEVYTAFPMKITIPSEDGINTQKARIQFDNVSLDLIDEFRTVTDPIDVKIDIILASDPDTIEISFQELKIGNIRYDSRFVQADLFLDDFLNTELTSERYSPSIYPGLFT